MSNKYRIYTRANGVFYLEDILSGKQTSLRTKDPEEAQRLFSARNEAAREVLVRREVGLAYLSAADPEIKSRTWRWVIERIVESKTGENKYRWEVVARAKGLIPILDMALLDTRAEHFLKVLKDGKVSTNVYLRRIHNFALDMGWLGRPVIVRRQWPAVKFGKKRGITWEEHQRILANEVNAERRDFYELLWHTGAAQGDMAALRAEDVNHQDRTLRFFRKKTGGVSYQGFGGGVAEVLSRRPKNGLLFPYLSSVRSNDRATEFHQRCEQLGIKGVSLHSYRYAWAQRAKACGYPLRYAMLALGQGSKAVHAHYAGTEGTVPALETYEKAHRAEQEKKIVPLPPPESNAGTAGKQAAG